MIWWWYGTSFLFFGRDLRLFFSGVSNLMIQPNFDISISSNLWASSRDLLSLMLITIVFWIYYQMLIMLGALLPLNTQWVMAMVMAMSMVMAMVFNKKNSTLLKLETNSGLKEEGCDQYCLYYKMRHYRKYYLGEYLILLSVLQVHTYSCFYSRFATRVVRRVARAEKYDNK